LVSGIAVVGGFAYVSTLGTSVANAVFTVVAQMQIPRQYASRGVSTGRYLNIIGKATAILAISSLPAGFIFIHLINKLEFYKFFYAVAVGVLIEGGNAALGVYAHHMNINKEKMWVIPCAGLIGCTVTFLCLILPFKIDVYFRLSAALVFGQISALIIVNKFSKIKIKCESKSDLKI
jgi:hypothetical protein